MARDKSFAGGEAYSLMVLVETRADDDVVDMLSIEFAVQVAVYSLVAAWSAFVWDTLLCFLDEYRYFWRRKFSLSTFLYFLNRYVVAVNLVVSGIAVFRPPSPEVTVSIDMSSSSKPPLTPELSDLLGIFWKSHFSEAASLIQTAAAEAVILRRVIIITDLTHKRIKLILVGGFVIAFVPSIILTQLLTGSMSAATRTVFGTRTCVVLSVSPSSAVAVKFLVLFVLPISFHILLAGVSISVFTKTIQSTPLRSSVGVQLVSAMRWQSIAYFVFMLASVVVITLLGFYAPLAMEACIPIFLTFMALVSSRVLVFMQRESRRLLEGSSVELVVRTAVEVDSSLLNLGGDIEFSRSVPSGLDNTRTPT